MSAFSSGDVHLKGEGDFRPDGQPAGTAYLPHSCDEWVIGDADAVRQMIHDLQVVLAKMEEK